MNKFTQVLLKFQALTLRERLMAVVAVIVVLFFGLDFALLGPHRKESQLLQKQIAQQRTELEALTKAVTAGLTEKRPVDGLARERAELEDLRARVAQAESVLGIAAAGAPLSQLLRAMIVARPELTLASLRTLPVEVFYKPAMPTTGAQSGASAPKAVVPPQPTLYKHGVEVAIKGKYPALVSYLQSLQRTPNRLFWSSVKLDVVSYPEATLKVMIYTLSGRAESPLG